MYQQEIHFFWPLTEQIRLDLDYTPCEEFEEEKRKKFASDSILLSLGDCNLWGTTSINNANLNPSSFVFNSNKGEVMKMDQEGIKMYPSTSAAKNAGYWGLTDKDFRIYRLKKPNWLARKATELIFSWIWVDV
jgi:hypothetical protein